MWPLPVVVLHPGGDLEVGMREAEEQRLVQQFIAHPTIEALDIAVLHRPARRDVMPLHADLAAPCQHGIGGQLCAIVADDHARLAAPGDQLGQLAHDTAARDRCIRHRCQALPGHVALPLNFSTRWS